MAAENLTSTSSSDSNSDGWLRQAEAAALLRVSPRTLEGWRLRGSSPPYAKCGRIVVYRRRDLEEFLLSRRRTSTSANPHGS
jgi:hypothetical protein